MYWLFFYTFYCCQWGALLLKCNPTWHGARQCWRRPPCVSAPAERRSGCGPSPGPVPGLSVYAPAPGDPLPPLGWAMWPRPSAQHHSGSVLAHPAHRRYRSSANGKHRHSPLSGGKYLPPMQHLSFSPHKHLHPWMQCLGLQSYLPCWQVIIQTPTAVCLFANEGVTEMHTSKFCAIELLVFNTCINAHTGATKWIKMFPPPVGRPICLVKRSSAEEDLCRYLHC